MVISFARRLPAMLAKLPGDHQPHLSSETINSFKAIAGLVFKREIFLRNG
jgi:hypothetical protein